MKCVVGCIFIFLIAAAVADLDAKIKVWSSWGRGSKGRWSPPTFRANQPSISKVKTFRVLHPSTKKTETKSAAEEVRASVYDHRNAALLPTDSCGTQFSERIVNGNDASLGEYPWMALLLYEGTYRCGGSLISSQYVLTAGHCIPHTVGVYDAKLIGVRLGEHDLKSDPDCEGGICFTARNVTIEKAIPHPQFLRRYRAFDVALLRLAERVQFQDNIFPICLPMNEIVATVQEKESFIVSGWGYLENRKLADVKQFASLEHMEEGQCRTAYAISFNPKMHICAGGSGDGKDSCEGDSGGPLMAVRNMNGAVRYMAAGVLSLGPFVCGTAGLPGLYVRVFPLMNWILDNMSP